jgi:hypothetical protein
LKLTPATSATVAWGEVEALIDNRIKSAWQLANDKAQKLKWIP